MNRPPAGVIVYFAVWVVMAAGMAILYRVRRDAEFRIRWHARIVLVVSLVIMVFMYLAMPRLEVLLMVAVGGGLITAMNLFRTAICTKCGRIVPGSGGLMTRAKYCPSCGGATVRSKLFT